MKEIFKYGFFAAIAFIILSQFFQKSDKLVINEMEAAFNKQTTTIDSLLLINKNHQLIIIGLNAKIIDRGDSLRKLEETKDLLIKEYENKIAFNRYRTVYELQGYLTNRYPPRQRSDSAKVESRANN